MDEFQKQPAVYIMASRYRGTLYVGVTTALYLRVCDHKNERFDGFTRQYNVKTLVWYAHFVTMDEAIHREKLLKKWRREWKFRTIEEMNPDWMDLHDRIDAGAMFTDMQMGSR